MYSDDEPFWGEKYAVSDYNDARIFFDSHINEDVTFDFQRCYQST